MADYFIAKVTVNDAEAYAEYGKRFYAVFEKYNGTVLAADGDYEVLEGECGVDKLVIVSFPNAADLKAWYHSPEYQELVAVRAAASDAEVLLVHGV